MKKIDWRKIWEGNVQGWFQRDKKQSLRDNLVILVLSGILLFVIAIPVKSNQREEKKENTSKQESIQEDLMEETGDQNYESRQEEKLRQLLSSMEDVGEVEVMLTFVSSGEQIVEKEEPVSRSSTVEEDGEGGTRSVTKYEKGDSTVYQNKEGQPFVTKVLYPRVEGVLVIAEGAGDGRVNRSITEAVQALFGVEAHRVKVLPMRNKHISQTGLIQ